MKNIFKRTLAALAALTMVMFTSCAAVDTAVDKAKELGIGGDSSSHASAEEIMHGSNAANIVFIGGEINGEYVPDYTVAENLLDDVVLNGGSVAFVVPDGEPVENSSALIPVELIGDDIVGADSKRASRKTKIYSALLANRAKTPEHNILKALSVAADKVRGAGISDAVLVVLDSGVQTEGEFNFTTLVNEVDGSISKCNAESICDKLEAIKALPDLSCFKEVRWHGLGETCGEQVKLSSADKSVLKNIWENIIERGGSTFIEGEVYSVHESPEESELPEVTGINSVHDEVKSDPVPDKEDEVPEPEIKKIETKKVTNGQLGFEPDSAKFKDKAKALDEFRDVIEICKESPLSQMAIVGCCATYGDPDSARSFSFERAEAVRDLLLENGVKPEQIGMCVGIGFEKGNDFVKEDIVAGKLDETIANKNRCVYIVDMSDPKLDKIR